MTTVTLERSAAKWKGEGRSWSGMGRPGFTLIEMLVVVMIIGILAATAMVKITGLMESTRRSLAISQLRELQRLVDTFQAVNGKPPDAWLDMGMGPLPKDPWGNEYVYQSHAVVSILLFRTDGLLIAINTDYDLFSKGKDGQWLPDILGLLSSDDVIRADNGRFFGMAKDY